ncbi:11572_t:CDS:2, partial [Acaulospora colombiana]
VSLSAKGPQEVKKWIENGNAGWCIPGESMGPDLMTWLHLSNGKYLLLVIQAKCHFSGNKDTITAEATADAIRSLIPDKFFASLSLTEMLEYINKPSKGPFMGGRYNILRVVAAFPLDVNFSSISKHVQDALSEDKHDLASFSHTALVSALATISDYGENMVKELMKGVEEHRLKPSGGGDASEPSPKRRKMNDQDATRMFLDV